MLFYQSITILIEGLIYLNFFIYYILSKKLPNEKFSLIISINLKEFLTLLQSL